MTLSSEEQALFDHAKHSLPRWLTGAASAALEWLYGFTAEFSEIRSQGQDWLDITLLENATGVELDQHAKDRGTSRRFGESDIALRARLRSVTDAVTEPALKATIDSMLDALGLDPCGFVSLRRDGSHFQLPGASSTFLSRGYRLANTAGRPMGYIVILPYGTTTDIANSISEYLRQYGPAGYIYFVEIRINP